MVKPNKDLLLTLAQNATIRPLLRSLGIPTPVALDRGEGKFRQPPLSGYQCQVLGKGGGLSDTIGQLVSAKLGADILGNNSKASASSGPARIVIDATWVNSTSDVTDLALNVLQPVIRNKLPPQSKVVVLITDHHRRALQGGDDDITRSPLHAALTTGFSGLIRSLAKECGGAGTTVNLITIKPSSSSISEALSPALLSLAIWPLGFFLLPDSAYISGQELTVREPEWKRPPTASSSSSLLHNKLAMVTGACRGIGEAICLRLARDGAKVIGVDVPQASTRLEALMKKIGGVAIYEDITHPEAPLRLYDQVIMSNQNEDVGGLDLLIHNAGITRDRTLKKMKQEEFASVLSVNLDSIIKINQVFGLDKPTTTTAAGGGEGKPAVKQGGRILLMSSINGVAGALGQTNYSMTKAALIGYAHAMAPMLFKQGITINCLAPGFIETEMVDKMPARIKLIGRRSNALNQGGYPEDVAACISALCADDADGVTGQTLRVCGGNMVGR